MKDKWQKCPVCEGRKEINAVPDYPIYGQIECPVCDGFGIIEIESGKSPKELQDHITIKDLQDDDEAREERNYHLNCDRCGEPFWSNEAFPKPQICPSCYV